VSRHGRMGCPPCPGRCYVSLTLVVSLPSLFLSAMMLVWCKKRGQKRREEKKGEVKTSRSLQGKKEDKKR
jgi:hypothetical protein